MNTTSYNKPLPRITATNKPFWDAARQHEVRMPRCKSCGQLSYPIAPHCLHCWSDSFEWARLSGRGKVNGFTIYHQAFHEAYRDNVPYNVVEVELEEGPRLVSNLVGVKNEEIEVGMPVVAYFDDVTPGITLIKFKPAS